MNVGGRMAPLAWLAVFLVLQLAALVAVLAIDPSGFDPCGPEAPGPTGVQATIAGVALLASVVHAAWRLRGRLLLSALLCVAFAVLVWFWLLTDPGASC